MTGVYFAAPAGDENETSQVPLMFPAPARHFNRLLFRDSRKTG
jgi:hypothetical protein